MKNFRIISLPESFNADSLHDISIRHISNALGITTPCMMEKAHCLGTPSNDRCTPHPVIVCYLNYMDRVSILKSFCNSKLLQLNGNNLFMFTDYSQEVSRRRKAFQTICQALYQKGVKFTLAYPANLRLTDPSGDPK